MIFIRVNHHCTDTGTFYQSGPAKIEFDGQSLSVASCLSNRDPGVSSPFIQGAYIKFETLDSVSRKYM